MTVNNKAKIVSSDLKTELIKLKEELENKIKLVSITDEKTKIKNRKEKKQNKKEKSDHVKVISGYEHKLLVLHQKSHEIVKVYYENQSLENFIDINKEIDEIRSHLVELHILIDSYSEIFREKSSFFNKLKYTVNNINKQKFLSILAIIIVLAGSLLLVSLIGVKDEIAKKTSYIIGVIIYFLFNLGLCFWMLEGENFNDGVRFESKYISNKSKRQTKEKIINLIGKDNALIEQYKISIDLEKHYEKVMWDIGRVLLTGSAAAIPLAVKYFGDMNEDILGYSIIAFSVILYLVFLFLSKRYRASIRKFRNIAKIIEQELNWLPYKYVYELEKTSFGNPTKVWTIFVELYAILISVASAIVIYQLWH